MLWSREISPSLKRNEINIGFQIHVSLSFAACLPSPQRMINILVVSGYSRTWLSSCKNEASVDIHYVRRYFLVDTRVSKDDPFFFLFHLYRFALTIKQRKRGFRQGSNLCFLLNWKAECDSGVVTGKQSFIYTFKECTCLGSGFLDSSRLFDFVTEM